MKCYVYDQYLLRLLIGRVVLLMALPRLHEVALKALAVPATSAAVEHVYSCGGMFVQPHRP